MACAYWNGERAAREGAKMKKVGYRKGKERRRAWRVVCLEN